MICSTRYKKPNIIIWIIFQKIINIIQNIKTIKRTLLYQINRGTSN